MAAPVDAGRQPTNITSATDPWTVNLPGSIASGDLLIMIARSAGGGQHNTPSGWTTIKNQTSGLDWINASGDASDDFSSGWWRLADGTEGANISLDLTATAKGAVIVWRITGAANPATTPPTLEDAVGTGANCDPISLSPTGGSKEYLFIVWAGLDGETQTFTAPTNYVNLEQANSGTGGAAATNCRVAGASRAVTTATEDPGTFTNGAPSNGWTAVTLGVHPAVATQSLMLPNPVRSIVRGR